METVNIQPTRVNRIKNAFRRNGKVVVAVVVTSTVWYAINRAALAQHDAFLREHELYDEFYNSEEE